MSSFIISKKRDYTKSESYLPDWIDAHCAEAHLRHFLQVEQQCGLSRDFADFSNDNFSHLEIFHVMLQGDFKAIVGRIEVVWNGHWVKHSYSWRPSNLQGEVSLCHGVCSSNTIHTLYSKFLNHQYLISVARLFCTVYSGNSYVRLPT